MPREKINERRVWDATTALLSTPTSLAACCVFVIAGCGGSTGGTSALKPIDPTTLQATVDATAKDLLVPGAFVLLRTPQGEFPVTYGSTERGDGNPPGPDTHFRVGSVTKTMSAATILQLAQEGALRLDDPVAKYRSDVPGGDHIDIRQLLAMHSGLYNYTADPDFWPVLDRDRTKLWTPDELLAIAFGHENHDPGPFDYCNTNTVLLGLIAEQLEQKPLSEIFRDRFFTPLGMTDTILPDATFATLPAPHARGYVYDSIIHVFLPVPYSPEIQAEARAGTLAPEDFTDLNPTWAWAAGGVISTAADLATWIEAWVGGKLLNREYQSILRESLQPIDPSQPEGAQYGYGIVRLSFGPNKIFFHNGELPGYNTFAGYDPVNRVTMVVWTSLPVALDNQSPEGPAERITAKLAEDIYRSSPSTVDPDIPGN